MGFGFIGLHNFIPVVIAGGRAYIEGAPDAGVVTSELPPSLHGQEQTVAFRPSEINLNRERGIRGIVKRHVYLGDTVDYRVAVKDVETRCRRIREKAYSWRAMPAVYRSIICFGTAGVNERNR